MLASLAGGYGMGHAQPVALGTEKAGKKHIS